MSEPEHHHHHEVPADSSDDEQLVFLTYLLNHNHDHVHELAEAVQATTGRAADLLKEAIAAYEEGNERLHEAIHALEEDATCA